MEEHGASDLHNFCTKKTVYLLPLRIVVHILKRPVLLIFITVSTVIFIFYNTRSAFILYNTPAHNSQQPTIKLTNRSPTELTTTANNSSQLQQPTTTDTSVSVLWYTSLEGRGEESSGFIHESLNFMIPLFSLLDFGWYAGCSISELKRNSFFAEFSKPHQGILLDLFEKGDHIYNEMLDNQNNVITIVFARPNQYEEVFKNTRTKNSVYNVGRAMFETDWIPNKWDSWINEYLDELWVPSTFAKKIFQSAGVKKPIKIIGEGFNPDAFSRVLNNNEIVSFRKKFFPNCRDSDVIFMSVGRMDKRKGMDILIDTWLKTFKAAAPACLYIRAAMKSDHRKKLQKSGLRIYELKRLSNEDLVLSYQSADVFVLPTHGEGWGRPIMEAMAAGLPVIVPLWSAITEFVKEDYSIPLHVDKLEPAFKGQEWFVGGKQYLSKHHWASINTKELSSLLVWCTEHRQELPIIGAKAKTAMFANFTWETISRDVQVRIDEIYQENGFYQKGNKKQILLGDDEERTHQLQKEDKN